MLAHTVQVNRCVWTPELQINVLKLYGPITKELSIGNWQKIRLKAERQVCLLATMLSRQKHAALIICAFLCA